MYSTESQMSLSSAFFTYEGIQKAKFGQIVCHLSALVTRPSLSLLSYCLGCNSYNVKYKYNLIKIKFPNEQQPKSLLIFFGS